MAWFWTDQLADLLAAAGVTSLEELRTRPVAIAAPDEAAALEAVFRTFGIARPDGEAGSGVDAA